MRAARRFARRVGLARLVVSFTIPALGGCFDFQEGRDAKVPGDALGTFEVTGKLREDSCKAGVLGVTDPWLFGVKLSRLGDDLYWLNGREAIVGDIEKDKVSFKFETRVDVKVEPPRAGHPGCTFERSDAAHGRLSAATNDVEAFDGTVTFSYVAKAKSDCSGWMGVEGGFGNLPCTVAYELTAKRTEPLEQD